LTLNPPFVKVHKLLEISGKQMQAVVSIKGQQHQVEEGRYILVDLMDDAPETEITLDQVLVLSQGDQTTIGQPYIEGAVVKGKILSHGKHAKILVYKMQRKKGFRKKQGHRQQFTRLMVTSISSPA
jgi:large subunit ribosomal protein L21